MEDLFGNQISEPGKPIKNKSGAFNFNPCIPVYGKGPEGTKCKTCIHLYGIEHARVYYKCELRGKPTSGPATDHKVNWPTCGKYETEQTQ